MKTKSIKKRILAPFLILLVVIPVATLIVFNLSMRTYVHKTAREELVAASKYLTVTINRELVENRPDLTDKRKIATVIQTIRNAIKASKISVNIDLFLVGENEGALYSAFDNTELLDKINFENIEEISSLRTEEGRFLVTGKKVTGTERSLHVVLVSALSGANAYIRFINLILLILLGAGIGVSIVVSNRISGKIAKSMASLCDTAKNISRGNFDVDIAPSDIEEVMLLQSEITKMSRRIKASGEAQRTFLQNASHELRTPLMSIGGYAEGIETGVLPDAKKAAGIIKAESNRLNELVAELLTLSKIESRSYEESFAELNLSQLLLDYKVRLDGLALGVNKQIILEAEENVIIKGSEHLVSQIVFNLAANALRYAKSEVRITLAGKTLTISDDGDGIAEGDLPYIFERFYKGKKGKFGLGLAIAKTAVLSMGGKIRAYNQNGAVFEVGF